VAAWVTGTRAMKKALLLALLEPRETLQRCEAEGDLTARLALMEEIKSLPWGAVWEELCGRENIPGDRAWLDEVRQYEKDVLAKRDG
jgi:L-rhamnose isomerase